MLSLSTALDTADQDLLLNDLFALGIDGKVLDWFRTYLKNRILRVCVNNTLSGECLMKTEVSRGSISGPILFLIYTIEHRYVPESLEVVYHCYADDTQIYFNFESINEAENKHGVIFNKVDERMQSRRLKLNSDKTECILVTANNSMHRTVDIHSLMLGNLSVQIPNSVYGT